MSIRTTCSIGALALGAVLSFTSLTLAQTTYYVNGSCGDDSWTGLSPVCEAPNGPKATIQAGINAADHFDSVEVADGIYTGPGNKNLEFFEKEMSIRSAGGPANCIIDCENDGLGFTFCTLPDDRPVTIEGFTIRNGSHPWVGGICISAADVEIIDCMLEHCVGTGLNPAALGGAISIQGTSIGGRSNVRIVRTVIRNNETRGGYGGGATVGALATASFEFCTIQGNTSNQGIGRGGFGGGIYIDSEAECHISDSEILDNTLPWGHTGAGVCMETTGGPNRATSSIRRSLIANNRAEFQPNELFGVGGGALLAGPMIIEDCEVRGNEARFAGGLSWSGGRDESLEMRDVLVTENAARSDGGGLHLNGRYEERQSLLERVRVIGNRAVTDGGGARFFDGQFLIRNSLIARNHAGANGGGIFADEAAIVLTNITVADNSSGGSGGGLFFGILTGPHQLANSIIHSNAPESIVDDSGILQILRSNIDDAWPGVGNLDVDPRFVDPANDDYRLRAGSPCIDSGDNRQVDEGKDLAGLPRRMDDRGMPDAGIGLNAIVDMGCYEFQGTSTGFIAVHPRPGVAGRDNQLQAAGATPGNVVYFVYGFATGSTGVPGCPGLTIDIANPRIAAQSTADATGYASKIINIPIAGSGRAIILQAVDRDACAVSNAIGYRFP